MRITITVIAVGLLTGLALPSMAQAPSTVDKARTQLQQDRRALEDARKSGDQARIRAAEDKVKSSLVAILLQLGRAGLGFGFARLLPFAV